MKIDVVEAATMIAKIGAAAAVLGGFFSWGWNAHNSFLMEQLAPMKRTALVTRINNYRKKQCMGDFTNQVDLDLALAEYEQLVGRPISDRDCESLP